ncbi:MAG: recombination mediator RecR [Pseudomonadota bacterium]
MKNPLSELINELSKLPGIGRKSASKISYHIYRSDEAYNKRLSEVICEIKQKIRLCKMCFCLTEKEICEICDSGLRDKNILCVVKEPEDVFLIEKTREFHGIYHVLHGLISPIDGINPADLKIDELLKKVENNTVTEIIIALNPNIKGDATSLYISSILKNRNIKITRLASGLPFGSDLEYIDDLTLKMALTERREM